MSVESREGLIFVWLILLSHHIMFRQKRKTGNASLSPSAIDESKFESVEQTHLMLNTSAFGSVGLDDTVRYHSSFAHATEAILCIVVRDSIDAVNRR